MRLTVITLALLPFAAVAQSNDSTAPTPQSCPVGMVWDSAAGTCTKAAGGTSPFDSIPDRSNCNGTPMIVA